MNKYIVMVSIRNCPVELFSISESTTEEQVKTHLETTMGFDEDRGDTFSIHDPFFLAL